jgi:hypothetical protein
MLYTYFHLPPIAENPFPKRKAGWNDIVPPAVVSFHQSVYVSRGLKLRDDRLRNLERRISWQLNMSGLRRSGVVIHSLIPTFYIGLPRWKPFRVSVFVTYSGTFHLITFGNRLQQFTCRHMSTVLLTIVDNIADICRQYC